MSSHDIWITLRWFAFLSLNCFLLADCISANTPPSSTGVVAESSSTTSKQEPDRIPTATPTGTASPMPTATVTLTGTPATTQTRKVPPSATPELTATAPVTGVSFLEQTGELEVASSGLFALSPGGTFVATSLLSDAFTTIDLFAVATGELVWSFDKGVSGINGTTSYAFSGNGVLLAAGGFEQVVHVLNVETGELIYELPMSNFIKAVDFSANGDYLAAAASHERGRVRVWSVNTADYFDYPGPIPALDIAFSPKEPVLAIAQNYLAPHLPGDGGVLLWDLRTGDVGKIFPEETAEVVAISPAGDFLAARVGESLRLWDLESELEIEVAENKLERGRIENIVFLDDEIFAVSIAIEDNSAGDQTVIKVWNTQGDFLGEATLDGLQHIESSPEGHLLTGQYGERIQVWRVRRP